MQRVQVEDQNRMHQLQNVHLGPEKFTRADDARQALQESGSLTDFWFSDGGDILCHPALVIPFLAAFDTTDAQVDAEKYRHQTEVIHCVPKFGHWQQSPRQCTVALPWCGSA